MSNPHSEALSAGDDVTARAWRAGYAQAQRDIVKTLRATAAAMAAQGSSGTGIPPAALADTIEKEIKR